VEIGADNERNRATERRISPPRHQFDVKVPEQLSVVGFDDIQDARWPPYELTTIRHPVESLAGAAMVEGTLEQDTALEMLAPKLISRTTVALTGRKTGKTAGFLHLKEGF